MKVARIGLNSIYRDVDSARHAAQHCIHLLAKIDTRWELVPIEKRRWASSRRKVKR